MKLHRAIRFSSREWWYIATTIALLAAGVLIAWKTHDATWLSRIGSIIVVVGVWFAFTDLPELLGEQARKLAKLRMELTFQAMLNDKEEIDHEFYTAEEQARLRRNFEAAKKRTFEQEANLPKKRFHAIEVGIVCVGTMANGWGQWLLESLWCQ